jgi:flagellar protein FlgJ
MISRFDLAGTLVVDPRSADRLRLEARQRPDQALKSAAQQFEALFMNMLLKSMRDGTPKDGIFDSDQTRLYTSMLDQQLAQKLSARGVGLADIMVKQLTRGANPQAHASTTPAADTPAAPGGEPLLRDDRFSPEVLDAAAVQDDPVEDELGSLQWLAPNEASVRNHSVNVAVPFSLGVRHMPRPVAAQAADVSAQKRTVPPTSGAAAKTEPAGAVPGPNRDFATRLWEHARAAAQATGIPPQFMLAQAALESGWGRHEIRRDDGSPSYNLFGIKAGRNWSGQIVTRATTEYVGGRARTMRETFRAYGSYAEAFRDYANLMASNPRYAAVLKQKDAAGFARSLQQAGYATDPQYADKLIRIMSGDVLRSNVTT